MSENGNNVKSVLKAFAIIETLNEWGSLSIGELSEKLSMDKATIHRLVNTVRVAGYVNQSPETKKYANSLKLFEIGQQVVSRLGVNEISKPFIEKLAQATGETVNLGLLKENKIVYIDKIEGQAAIKVGITIGASIPLHCTGMGKAVLAFMDEKRKAELLGEIKFAAYAKNSALTIEEVEEKLRVCRRQGYSMDNEEYVDNLISFGAPIFDMAGKPVAAISISCPKIRYDEKKQGKSFPELVLRAAGEISRQMGFLEKNI